jgi:hypothetical protein
MGHGPVSAVGFTPQDAARIAAVVKHVERIVPPTGTGEAIPRDENFGADVFFGLVQADFTSGTDISVKHCDGNGVTEGDALNVKVYAGGGSANLGSVIVAGASAAVSCKLAAGKIIAYSYSAGTAYLVGDVAQIVFDVRYDATSHKLQAKFYWRVGIAVSSVSDWADVRAYSAVTAITAWQVDSTSGEIQKKTQAFYSPEVGAESAWTKIDDTQESDYVPCS